MPLDDTVSVINPANNNVVTTTIAVGGRPVAIAFGPGPTGTGSYAYVANFLSNSVSVIDTNPYSPTFNTALANITVGGEPVGVAVSPDGKHLYVAQSYTNSIAIIDTATSTETTSLATTTDGGPTAVVATGDNTHAYVTNLYSSIIDHVSVTPTLTPTPSAAPTPPLGSTHGFKVYNLSSQPATLGGYIGNGKLQSPAPGPGTVVAPGSYIDFEVIVYSGHNNTVQPFFFLPSAEPSSPTVALKVWLQNVNVNVTRHIARCGANDGNQCQAIPGYKVALLDPTGTVVTLDANQTSQAQQIARALNELCFKGSPATCNFTGTSEQVTHDKGKPVGNALQNDTNVELTLKTTATRTVTDSIQDSVQLTVANRESFIFEQVNAELQVKFQHTWTETKTFSHELDIPVPPHTQAAISVAEPIYRDYGNFTLQMGNTTWNLDNVYFDSPNPNGQGNLRRHRDAARGPPTQ